MQTVYVDQKTPFQHPAPNKNRITHAVAVRKGYAATYGFVTQVQGCFDDITLFHFSEGVFDPFYAEGFKAVRLALILLKGKIQYRFSVFLLQINALTVQGRGVGAGIDLCFQPEQLQPGKIYKLATSDQTKFMCAQAHGAGKIVPRLLHVAACRFVAGNVQILGQTRGPASLPYCPIR